ncbi:MAG TPA: hypothetical protein VGK10_03365 [Prolixibacteraceae bacterium]|jgi:hypothetical protein
MGLIREPKNVDFTVIDQPWTEEERKELSVYIKIKKEKQKKRNKPSTSTSNKEVIS